MPGKKAMAMVLLLGTVVLVHASLWKAYFTDDDFEDVLAVRDGTVFTGRPGFWNYNPVMGLLWLPVRSASLESSAVYLRLVNTLILMITPCALLLFLRTMGANWFMAWLASWLYVLHPLGFEAEIRLCNMHYTLALMFMLLALNSGARWLRDGRGKHRVSAVIFQLLCLFSSFIGISVVPALVALHLFKDPDAKDRGWPVSWPVVRRALTWLVPGLLYLAVFYLVLSSGNLSPGKKYAAAPGMFIVFHLWMPYGLLAWDPYWGVLSYIKLCTIKTLHLPLLAWGLSGMFWSVVGWVAWRQRARYPWIPFAFIALMVTVVVPPKPHYMPRWCYFSVPWIAVLQASVIGGLLAGRGRGGMPRALAVAVLMGMIFSSGRWYAYQIRNLRFCAGVTRALTRAVREVRPAERLVLLNVPEGAGFDRPWPRQTYFSPYQLELSLKQTGRYPAAGVEVHWLDRQADPRHPGLVDRVAWDQQDHLAALVWDGRLFRSPDRPAH